MIIDSHQHFWQLSQPFNYAWLATPEKAAIHRDFLPADLEPLMRAAGVDRSIFVQTQHSVLENHWVLGLAEKAEFIAGVVGWVDLASDDCERQIEEFSAYEKFVGVRHVTHDEPDNNFLNRDDVLRGLGLLEKHRVPFDLLLFVKHLRHVPILARKFPDLPMVIDHLAKPRIKEHVTDDWLPEFRAAAAFTNVYCKLSGMVTEADWQRWSVDDLRPYVQTALDLFRPDRLMYGSDWPVCELAGSYVRVKEALAEALGPISDADRDKIFGGTAAQFYRLSSGSQMGSS